MSIIVAGIGTEIGKTVVSAILCSAFGMDYWKTIQAGELDKSDSSRVLSLVNNHDLVVHPEQFKLSLPMSPHAAAEADGISIAVKDFDLPVAVSSSGVVVELAGGLLVPINMQETNIDIVSHLSLPVVLVANYYLGSINHTLLSLELLKSRDVHCLGVIFVGEPNVQSREVIVAQSGVKILAEIPHADTVDAVFVAEQAAKITSFL